VQAQTRVSAHCCNSDHGFDYYFDVLMNRDGCYWLLVFSGNGDEMKVQTQGNQHRGSVPILAAVIGFPACTARRFSHKKPCYIKSSFLFGNILAGVAAKPHRGAAMSPPTVLTLERSVEGLGGVFSKTS
jgi:hypothetical protein